MENKGHTGTEKDKRSLVIDEESKDSSSSFFSNLDSEILSIKNSIQDTSVSIKSSDYSHLISLLKKGTFTSENLPLSMKDMMRTIDQTRKSQSLNEFFLTIFNAPIFKNVSQLQFVIHRLGNKSADSYTVGDGVIKDKKVPIEKYNSLFTSVSKSKSHSFDQGTLLSGIIDSSGFFLADAQRLRGSSLIIVLSNNSFLQPDISEINKLKFLTSVIVESFERHINLETTQRRKEYAEELIKNLPLELDLSQGDAKGKDSFQQEIDGHLVTLTFPSDTSVTNIYHHERISLLGDLLNTLQHELSNPLFGLNLSTSMLLMEEFNEDAKETIQEISESIKRCEQIIKSFSHLYKDKSTNTKISLIGLIKETLILAKSESKQIQKKIHHNLDDSEFLISTNPTWVSQILFNLIINSSQALNSTERRDKEINITLEKDSDYFIVQVEDNGPGIAKPLIDKIFDPFYTTKKTGTGLGLSICQNLAKKLGGKLEFIHKSNGACFKLVIKNEENSTY